MSSNTAPIAADPKAFKTFAEFYPFYLGEHRKRTCRRLHFLGSTPALVCLAMLVSTGWPPYLLSLRLWLCLDRAPRVRVEQARQLQARALQLDGRLRVVPGQLGLAHSALGKKLPARRPRPSGKVLSAAALARPASINTHSLAPPPDQGGLTPRNQTLTIRNFKYVFRAKGLRRNVWGD